MDKKRKAGFRRSRGIAFAMAASMILTFLPMQAQAEETVSVGERTDISAEYIVDVTADSQQDDSGNAMKNAADGNPETIWHSSWQSGHGTVPISITLELSETVEELTQLRYLPRQDDKNGEYQWNGDILGYEIWVSETDAEAGSFAKVAEGTWEGTKDEKSATFSPVNAKYVRLTATHTKGNNDNEYDQFASAAEIVLAVGGQTDIEGRKQKLGEALAAAKEFLEETTKTDTELMNLNSLIKTAENLLADGYLPAEENLSGTAEALLAEVERLQNDAPVTNYTSFLPNGDWQDTSGTRIQAHGGGVIWDENTGKYYWYGENKGADNFSAAIGVSCYSSTDLYNWKNEGVALPVFNNPAFLGEEGTDYTADTPLYLAESSDEYQAAKASGADVSPYDTLEKYNSSSYIRKLNELYDGMSAGEKKELYDKLNWNCVLERPKVIYNDTTGQYVMWFHKDGPTAGKYDLAQTGIAVSDSPAGPFKLVDSIRPNGFESRDMTLFKDDDGKAYLLHSSEGNKTLYIAELTDDYTGLTGNYSRNYIEQSGSMAYYAREAPALFKYDGKYYLLSSGCTGWDPNQMGYSVTDDLRRGMSADGGDGPFQIEGLKNPCIGTESDITYRGQSTYVLPVQGKEGCFIYMGDRWNKYNLQDSRYQWFPIQIDAENSTLTIAWNDEWSLDAFDSLNTEARSELNRAVKEGKALSEDEYGGTERWDKLQQMLNEAGDLDYLADENTVREMTVKIDTAMDAIKTWGSLESALESAEALYEGDYTPETWEQVRTAYEAGKALEEGAGTEEILQAAENLREAIGCLVEAELDLVTYSLENASVTADSQHDGNEAELAVDGETGTFWHSRWGSGAAELPHYITINLGEAVDNLYRLTYLPRQDSSSNGIVTRYEIWVSAGTEDGSVPADEDFRCVRTGTWEMDKTEKYASFETEGAVRYVRFKVLEGYGGFASAAEIGLMTLNNTEDLDQPLRITENPKDAEGAAGDNAVFTVAAEGTGLTYQWQYCNANSSVWRDSAMSGNDTPEITVPIAKYRDGQKYRCVVTDQDGSSVTSESASIKMTIPEDMPVITSQPEDFTGIAGEKAVFEVKAEGTNLTYQWQYCNEGSNVWRNSSMEGSTTSGISVEIASYRDGQKYRCVVTGGAGHIVTSDAAAIIVGLGEGAPQITGQPENYAGVIGDTAVFEVKASGINLAYQWQYCNADSSVWRASSMEGSTTASVSVPVTVGRDGQKYRCVITSGNGRTAITETVVLTVAAE